MRAFVAGVKVGLKTKGDRGNVPVAFGQILVVQSQEGDIVGEIDSWLEVIVGQRLEVSHVGVGNVTLGDFAKGQNHLLVFPGT